MTVTVGPLQAVTAIASRIEDAMARAVMEGRKCGLVVVLLAQRMDASIVGGAARSNFGTTITLGVAREDALAMLHADIDRELVLKVRSFPPGRGLYETVGVPLTVFQSDFTTYKDYLRVVREAAPKAAAVAEMDR